VPLDTLIILAMHFKRSLLYFIICFTTPCFAQVENGIPLPELLPALKGMLLPTTTLPSSNSFLKVFIRQGKEIVNKEIVPQFSNYNKTVYPGESLVMTGANFTVPGEDSNGSQSKFAIGYFNGKGTLVVKPLICSFIENSKVVLSVSDSIKPGIYTIWARNKNGWGSPVIVNRPELWWVGPEDAILEDSVSYYGTNLSKNAAEGSLSWLYLKPVNERQQGVWLKARNANNYKATFLLHGIQEGEYTTWLQNGLADKLGFSRPVKLTIKKGFNWGVNKLNVKDPRFGARGDGVTDDQAAIQKCILEACKIPFSTVYFPEGIYKVSQGFNPPSNIEWLGDGKNKTQLLLSKQFVYNPAFSRQYTLLFSNENSVQCTNARFRNMSFKAMPGTTGQMKSIIYMRGSVNVHFENCLIEAIPGFERLDMSNSRNIYFDGDELILNGAFFSNAKQFFFRNTICKAILDANVMLEFWGCNGVSVTGCLAKDKDSSNKGQSIGRFFYGNNIWGSNINIYLANNTTQNLAPRKSPEVDQNSGEQFLWEGTNIVYLGKGLCNYSGELSIRGFNPGQNDLAQLNMGVFIIKGRGAGQYNGVKKATLSSVTLSGPWNVVPDTSSVFMISSYSGNCVIYRNTIDGKAERIKDNIASAGIQLYGNSMNFICDRNLIKEVVTGISTWAQIGGYAQHSNVQSFCYFNEFRNNICKNVQTGLGISAYNWYNEPNHYYQLYLGNTFIKNSFEQCNNSAIDMNAKQMTKENIELSVFLQNKFIGNKRNIKVNSGPKPGVNTRHLNNMQTFSSIQIPANQEW